MYENYAKIRDARGMKDSDVAKATGISAGTLSDWKRGRYNLKYDKLQKIAAFFGISVDELTGNEPVQTDVQGEYYISSETKAIAEEIFTTPGMRILFDAARDSRPEDLQMAADLLKRLKATNPDD